MDKRYAVIGRLTKQIGVFVNNPDSVNTKFSILVDLENHSQKNEVRIDWFYDEASNTFSPEGMVHYPGLSTPEPTQLDRMEALLTKSSENLQKSNEELRQEGADQVILELIERGVL